MEILIRTPEKDDYADARHERKPHGHFFIDGVERGVSLQCPHCGGHFLSVKGSGATRGFCTRCAAVTCGNPGCNACVPFEKWLEAVERAATREMRLGV